MKDMPDGLLLPPHWPWYFGEINRPCFLVPASPSHGNTAIEIIHADEAWRPIIACLAAQYWRNELVRLNLRPCSFECDKSQAFQQTDAWLRWGGVLP